MKGTDIAATSDLISFSDVIKDAGIFQNGERIPATLLMNMMVKNHTPIGALPLKDFLEERARRKQEEKDISGKIQYKEIDFRDGNEGPCVLFSRSDFDFKKAENRVRAVTSFPYLMAEFLSELLPDHKAVIIKEDEDAPSESAKKIVEIYAISHETIAEFNSGNYDLGLGTRHHGIEFKKKNKIKEIPPILVMVALKDNDEFTKSVNSIESVLEARESCELKICVPEEKISDAEKVLKAYMIQTAGGSKGYKWITVVVPLKKKPRLWEKLKEAGAEEIYEQAVKALDKCV